MGHAIYSLYHEVEISKRSKNVKNVQLSINVVIWMSTFFFYIKLSFTNFFQHVSKLNFELQPVAFETFAYFNFMGHAIYSQSHKVATLSNVSKVKFKFKICRYLAKHCPFTCLELFERSLALQLYGTYYCVSHKVEISERFKSNVIEFKGQSSILKRRKKLMNRSLMEKTLTIKLPIWCSIVCFWRFRTFAYFNFMGQTIYTVSHKIATLSNV